MEYPQPPPWLTDALRAGMAIPAHPLAMDAQGRFDERHQRALTRYYAAAGAGGVAVGVHTTQFEIRDPSVGLLEPVLLCAAETINDIDRDREPADPLVRIAGICGPTAHATAEAELAASLGYHVGLLSLAAMGDATDDDLIDHCRQVARVIPLMGFYLQPAVGGRKLSRDFWRKFAEIPNVVAIKVAPFNRYQTLDVVRGVAEAGRAGDIALYTGNDDNIVIDLLTSFETLAGGRTVRQRFVGGLLGHWAVWTRRAVELHRSLASLAAAGLDTPADVLTAAAAVTDGNAALFDAAHGFAGCIAGIQHVLFGQGLLASPRCLNPREVLSPGQADEIARVRREHAHFIDDDFVAEHLHEWLG